MSEVNSRASDGEKELARTVLEKLRDPGAKMKFIKAAGGDADEVNEVLGVLRKVAENPKALHIHEGLNGISDECRRALTEYLREANKNPLPPAPEGEEDVVIDG